MTTNDDNNANKSIGTRIGCELDNNGIIHKALVLHLYGDYTTSNQTKVYNRLRKGMPLKDGEYTNVKAFFSLLSIQLRIIANKIKKHSKDKDITFILIKEIKKSIRAVHIAKKSELNLSLVQKYFATGGMPPKTALKVSNAIELIASDIEKSYFNF